MAIVSIMALASNATQITDIVDSTNGWTVIDYGSFSTGADGLAPVEGADFFYYRTSGTRNAGVWKLFDDTFTNETLKVTYSLGEFANDTNPWEWTGGISPLLFADIDGDGQYLWSERIIPTTQVSHVTPTNGWEQWEDLYEITEATQTANGDLVSGKQIGFFVFSSVGSYENFTFDSLQIETYVLPVTDVLIEDSVENDGLWTAIVNGSFSTSFANLTPVASSAFFRYNTTASGRTAGAWKLFDETFSAQNLEVSYYLGEFDGDWTWTGEVTPVLFADTDDDGQYLWSERILPTTVVSHPEPTDSWEQWVDQYEITAATTTVGGDPVIDSQIGFFVVTTIDSYESIAFDSLLIRILPTPATLSISYGETNISVTSLNLTPEATNTLHIKADLLLEDWLPVGDVFTGSSSNTWTVPNTNDSSFFRLISQH